MIKGIRELWWRVRSIARRRRLESGLDEELRFHVERLTEKHVRAGAPPDDALRQALVRLGGVERVKEQTRDEFRAGPLEDTMRDVRYGVRALRRTPSFTLAATLTMGLGIGAATALFSVVNGILIKPLPYPEAERLVDLNQSAPAIQLEELGMSPAQLFTYQDHNRVFEALGLYTQRTVAVTGRAQPEEVDALVVTEGTLRALGARPALGRVFSAADDAPRTPETVLLTHGYWQSRFGGNPAAIGQGLIVDGRPRQIVGVMPRDFRFLAGRAYMGSELNDTPQLILPFRFDRAQLRLGGFNWSGIGRLKPGVSLADANADLTRLVPIFLESWPLPEEFASRRAFESAGIRPELRPLKTRVVGNISDVLWVLSATIGIVLVIACANVANLLLVRTEGRRQELAVRSALGAGRWRVARALLVESLVLGISGGALGLVMAYFGLKALVAAGPASLPRLDEITIDPAVLVFTLAVSVVSGLAFGLAAVARRTSDDLARELRGGGRTSSSSRERHRTRHVLVVAQVGLATVLVVAAGLMVRSFVAMRGVHPGFNSAAEVQLVTLSIPAAVVPHAADVFQVQRDIHSRVASLHGVTAASFGSAIPLEGAGVADPVFIEHRAYAEGQIPPIRWFSFVSPGFFETMGTPLVAGRDFSWADIDARRPVAIVSESLARESWSDPAAAIGKRLRESPRAAWRYVIGVVADVHAAGVDVPPPAIAYWPAVMENFWGNTLQITRTMTFVVRSPRARTEGLVNEIRQAVADVNGQVPLTRVRTLDDVYVRSMARTSFALVMLAIAGLMALSLSVIGIYGVLSYTVAERTREIGIRVALGAEGAAVRRMFVVNGLVLAAGGIVLGLAAAVGLTQLMTSILFGVESLDPITYVTVSVVLVLAAALASYIPARRATGVSPVTALRAEF